MEIKQSEFITSAVSFSQYPKNNFPQAAFVGRSNVGKSSLINALTNRRKLARISSTPGKTRLINFYLINNNMYFVDLPGYGYAKVSKDEKKSWAKMIEDYLQKSDRLKKVILLVDSRRAPTDDDKMMYDWIKHYNYEIVVIATKVDKLNQSDIAKNRKLIRDKLELDDTEEILFFSSIKKTGLKQITKKIFDNINL